jgi:hypothetical protein
MRFLRPLFLYGSTPSGTSKSIVNFGASETEASGVLPAALVPQPQRDLVSSMPASPPPREAMHTRKPILDLDKRTERIGLATKNAYSVTESIRAAVSLTANKQRDYSLLRVWEAVGSCADGKD